MKKHLLTNSYNGGITNLKRNAFTLIELLAIIVILAIIAVITVPIILNIIENSRKGAATDSAYGFKDSVNKYYISELQNHNKLKLDGTYDVDSEGKLTPAEGNSFKFGYDDEYDSLDVPVSGTIPSSGKLRYSNNVLNAGCVVIGDYKVTFGTDGKVDGTVKGDCSNYEFPTTSGSETSGGSTPATQYGYKSYDAENGEETEIMIGTSNPTGKNAYLKYDLANGEVADETVPEACIYNDTYGGELCLKINEYETSLQKILDYFGYDEKAWVQDSNDSSIWYNSTENPTITCGFYEESSNCGSSDINAGASHYGSVNTYDGSTFFNCYIYDDGSAYCNDD